MQSPSRKSLIACLSASISLQFFSVALAQSVDPNDSANNADSWLIETIEVTGKKREGYSVPQSSTATRTNTPLIEVPQSVQVITDTLLKEQDLRQLGEALVNVSGITPTRPDENLFIPPIVRGFPAEVYLDGLPVFAGNQQAYDPASIAGVTRIDVLKGPSGSLYGGGLGTPLGGLINIVSTRPTDEFGGYVALRGGSFSTINPYAELNVPLAEGVAAKVVAEYQSNDSWIYLVEGERWSLMPSLAIEIGKNTELLVQGQLNHRSNLEYSGIPAEQALAGEIRKDAFPGSPINQPHTKNSNQMGTVSLRHTFSNRLELNMMARYYSGDIDEHGSFVYPDMFPADPATPTIYPVAPVTMDTNTRETTIDINLIANTRIMGTEHTLLSGVNYDRTTFYSGMGFFISDTPSGTIDLANPVYNLSYTPQLPVNSYTDDIFETAAVYFQDQVSFGSLHLTGGIRFTSLKFEENSNIGVANDATYSRLSPRIGATYDLTSGIAIYAGYATAFRAPFGFIGLERAEPETSENSEIGVKLSLPEAGISGTIAAFEQKREKVSLSDTNNIGFFIQSGEQRAKGIELDVVWEPSPAFSLLANYAFTDTRGDGSDNLTRVPENSGRLAARYRIFNGALNGLSFGVGISAFSSRELTLPNTIAAPGYAVINAQASYDFGHYSLALSVVNLGDRDVFDPYSYFGNAIVAPTQPRSAYLTLKASL